MKIRVLTIIALAVVLAYYYVEAGMLMGKGLGGGKLYYLLTSDKRYVIFFIFH